MMLRWLRRWRERDDQHPFKAAATAPVDPIGELIRVVAEEKAWQSRQSPRHGSGEA
jgi:hypothetical protein